MSIESYYEYPAGVALSRFLAGLRDGKIVASRCGVCGASYLPPRAFCLKCLKPVSEFHEVEGFGFVETFTRSYISLEGVLHQPITWIFVRFEGVVGGLLHRLDPSAEPRRGLRVVPVFHAERVGSILDIKWFTSAE